MRTEPSVVGDGRGPVLPYPSGWFCLALSRELAPGAVLSRRFAGEDVVLYRTRDGRPRAVRPYCPHLGAHLGLGTVEGRNLVCPFHNFAYAPDGACVHAPGGRAPRIRLEHHTLRERDGFVFVWRGHDDAPPTWEIPGAPGAIPPPTAVWTADVLTHAQDLSENSLDYRHLNTLHGVAVRELVPPQAEGPFLRLRLQLAPKRFPALKITSEYAFLLAGVGCFRTDTSMPPLGLAIHLWAMHTPTGPRSTRMLVAAACTGLDGTPRSALPLLQQPLARSVARGILWGAVNALKDDLKIWNTKRYEPRPRLAAGDEAIGSYRSWVRQFYPPS
ncbi:Rieske 2Fe-2S domain-containing protein [Streptomyces hiroshimensis]|uniref:Rieske-type oxygenase n=1 Tax=Streptomyces hiroshimensis TaxID=66424 RepID=A0ABQ2Z9V9_9ACTN|nr:Rieske 2Fe-2S domain-containing protein [Streptomyces hiroshimensis]GGY08006.1 (2Fe-2S)-binding protein [Streptomyces hiroshimensis]